MSFVKRIYHIHEKQPLFVFLMRELNITQGEAQRMIDRGRVSISGKIIKDKSLVAKGEIEITVFEPHSILGAPVFSTDKFMVFEKPSGVLVHPKTMQTPHSMLDEVRYYGGFKANAVHRIDKETSGLLLASRDKQAEKFLKSSFENRTIKKKYRAWVRGRIESAFSVNQPIRLNRDYSECKHKAMISASGKAALTDFVPLYYDKDRDATLLECTPHTGRTHQIRLHLFHVKHSILGDPLYGTDFEIAEKYLEERLTESERLRYTGAPRLMLHAYSLEFYFANRFHIVSRNDFFREIERIWEE